MDILANFDAALDNMAAPSSTKPCFECAVYHGAKEPVKGCEECPQPTDWVVDGASNGWVQLKVTKTK